jgi:succinate dehydrogenase/fumarate reductase-like Fe-S protein
MERVQALLLLACSLVRSIVDGLLGRRRGVEQFRANYAPDRLPPIAPEERELLPLLSGCIACGMCNVADAARIGASKGAYAGPMDIALASSRSMPDFDAALISLAATTDEDLERAEQLCPTRVPIRKIAGFVRAKVVV